MITIKLYTKAGCGLCEKVKTQLESLGSAYTHRLVEVDITKDPALFEKYRYSIPVVTIGKQELAAPITAVQLRHALQTAVS